MFTSVELPDGLLLGLLISMISGFISISRRILSGHPVSFLWISSEFSAAVLCGYLMFEAYPFWEELHEKVPRIVAIAFTAHLGGMLFQTIETYLLKRISNFIK